MREKVFTLGDDIGFVELLYSMGNDLAIVNDARASYDKESFSWSEKDGKLLNYLIKHEHWSPFRGVVFKFRVKAPLFVCRQWWKHHIASSHVDEQNQWNEMSLRYVDMTGKAEFFIPEAFRGQSKGNKQVGDVNLSQEVIERSKAKYEASCNQSYMAYCEMVELGVCKEQARGVLPNTIYTTFIWTVSLQALMNFISLRDAHGAQSEIADYAKVIKDLIQPIVPHTIEAWVN